MDHYSGQNVTDSHEIANKKIRIAKKNDGFALENYFYRSPVIYQRELEDILFKSWFYACHISEIPHNGDFKTIEVDEDSIIIARDKEGKISASGQYLPPPWNPGMHRKTRQRHIICLPLPCMGIRSKRKINWGTFHG